MYKRPIQAHQIWWCTASIPLPHYFRRAQIPMHLWFRVCIQLLSVFFFFHMYIVDYVPWCTFIICQFFFICFCLIMCNISEYQNRFTVKTLFSVCCCYCWKDKKKISTLPTLFEGLDMRLSVDMYAIFATKETKQ